MTLATFEEVVDAEVVLTDSEAEDFDTRFQVALGSYAEARQELIDCVEFVRNTDIAERMGFKSRGDYIAARVAGLNVKWAVEDRRSLVELMAHPGDGPSLSLPQIKDALGVGLGTVHRDKVAVETTFPNGKVAERRVEGSDGKTRTYTTNTDWPEVPEPEPASRVENRNTDLANGLRNDSRMIANSYMDYLIAVAKNLPKEGLDAECTEHVIKALRDNLADITEVTNRAIAQIEGEGK